MPFRFINLLDLCSQFLFSILKRTYSYISHYTKNDIDRKVDELFIRFTWGVKAIGREAASLALVGKCFD